MGTSYGVMSSGVSGARPFCRRTEKGLGMDSYTTRLMAALLALSLNWATAGTAIGESLSPVQSHQRMVALLAELYERDLDHNTYQGEGWAQSLRTRLAALPTAAAQPKRAKLLYNLGIAELHLGNGAEAIAHLSTATNLLSTSGGAPAEAISVLLYRLGLAHMRQGEVENCRLHHSAEACLLPIQGSGVHTLQEGSQNAIKYFTQVLERTSPHSSIHLSTRWLLNLAHMTLGTYPETVPPAYRLPANTFKSESNFPHFTNIAPHIGLDTFSQAGGAVGDDFDQDGFLDVVVSNMNLVGPLRYFANRGNGTFVERSAEAGLQGIFGGLNLLQADYDNDGHLDLFVLRGAWLGNAGRHPNSLLRNNGQAIFTDVTFAAGLAEPAYPTQTGGWADYDLDGDVDLYVGNESKSELAAPGQLFRNEGNGTFTDIAIAARVTNNRFAKAVIWGDVDEDGDSDLYISNLGAANRLYRNEGDGTFTDVAQQQGVDGPLASFPSWFWDYDNDGHLDLFVAAYAVHISDIAASYLGRPVRAEQLAHLYKGDGRGGFEEVGRSCNLVQPTKPMGSNFGDLDNDGYLDFYLGTGDTDYEELMPNAMYHNQQGKRFVDVSFAGGFAHLQKGHGVVFADFDHDGDQDVFEQMGGAFAGDGYMDTFYENPGFGNHFLAMELVGVISNRSAIGTRLRVVVNTSGQEQSIYRWVGSGGSFGANPLRQTIGLGTAKQVVRLEVYWPTTGRTQIFEQVPVDCFIRIVEDQDSLQFLQRSRFNFSAVPSLIHTH